VWKRIHRPGGAVLWISEEATPGEIAAKLEAACELEPTIRNLKAALEAERDEGRRLEILNEEVKLAARLQRDFLPRSFPEVGTARFSVVFRPASFVSGDIYDVVRLDETHIGFYVADAVGHGMPAALLTMFIKKGLQTKRILNNTYEIIPPADSLGELNSSICDQNLSSCQFCTAIYCVLDTATGELDYTRAGHPEPILLRADGSTEALDAPGSLLGVFPEAQFETSRITMGKGDRLILYSDGAEAYARGDTSDGHAELVRFLETLAGLEKPDLDHKLSKWVDHVRQLSREEDDLTILVVDL
jgi:serine phosphatase RsbU (regulator of sigma subunit)